MVFILTILILVFVHELGHYVFARRAGVHVEVFSIGFGPELYGWNDKHGTRWRLSAVPLGGYVRMMGDASVDVNDLSQYKKDDHEKLYVTKSLGQRSLILGAGPLFNVIFAIIALAGLYLAQGKLQANDSLENGISTVMKESPAYEAGLKAGDIIIAIDGKPVTSYMELPNIVTESGGRVLTFTIARETGDVDIQITPRLKQIEGQPDRYFVGIGRPAPVYQSMSIVESLAIATSDIWEMTGFMFNAIGDLFVSDKPIEEQLAGPVRIAKISAAAASNGIDGFVLFLAVLSLNLAIMNLLPIPILDGGHLMYCLVEAIRGKPVSKNFQDKAFQVGFAILLIIMFFAILGDIKSIIG